MNKAQRTIENAGMISVRDFGATGDGKTNDTSAIQKAIDTVSAQSGGGVLFPSGKYMTSTLRVPSYVGLFGAPTWSYHDNGGTGLVLNDESRFVPHHRW